MSSASSVVIATRVDKVGTRANIGRAVRIIVSLGFALVTLIPIFWMVLTAFKARSDIVSAPPVLTFTPTLEGFVNLLTSRAQIPQDKAKAILSNPNVGTFDRIAAERGQTITGPSAYAGRVLNSVIISGASTFLSTLLGVLAAYAFSRFNVPGKPDLLFFILSTRMLPPVVVTIPIFLMYKEIGLRDTHLGLILLYTVFNLSFSVWLLKGFIDEIPKEYEEAALVDGYTRLQAFRKVVLPQAITGIAATFVFCLIFAWNEYAFALILTTERARTAPPSIPTMIGTGGVEWSAIAAGSLGFLIPVVIVTFALRDYLLRGVTFGALRK
jgi:multiple sugar transport system permease protein